MKKIITFIKVFAGSFAYAYRQSMAQCQAEHERQKAELLTAAEIYRAMKKSNPAAMRGTTAYAFSRMLPSIAQRVRRKYFNGYWVNRK